MSLSCVKTGKALVALSGGVDSSVAAMLLKNRGYEVVGAFLKIWSEEKNARGICNWKEERRCAYRVAAHLGIPCITLDFEKEYREKVAEYIYEEYSAGRTPNPDVICNEKIKFPLLRREAQARGFDLIATGHHARISPPFIKGGIKGGYKLLSGRDLKKDQSYFLHRLSQDDLCHTLFPIGDYTKEEVRKIARKCGLPSADKRSTRGICFIGKVKMSDFLSARIASKKGDVLRTDGKKIGTHDGAAHFTIGQRRGIGIGGGKPYYVAAKDPKTGTLTVAEEGDPALFADEILLKDVHWISGNPPKLPLKCQVRARYRASLTASILSPSTLGGDPPRNGAEEGAGSTHFIRFAKKIRTPAPGQFAVFYSGNECLGGGVIV